MQKQDSIDFDNMHKHVEGLISHVLVYLLALNWTPHSIIEWSNPLGERYIFSPGQAFPVMTLIFDILDSFHFLKAKDAQKHYQGGSLTSTIDWQQSLTRNRYLKKQKRDQELALLETIQAAAAWPIDRVHDIHPEVPNQCPLCQQEVDKWHTCWTCPELLQLEDDDIQNSNYLVTQLQNAINNDQRIHESLWLRGLVTKEHITPSPNHNPLEEYPVTIRDKDYVPPVTGPLVVQPQLSLNQYLKEHFPKPPQEEPLEPSKYISPS